jgi:hypothetical protein
MPSLYSISCHVLSNMSGVTEAITSRMRSRNVGRSGSRVAYTRSLTHLQKKKSSGVISGERGGQEIGPSCPIQRTIQEGSREGFSNVQTPVWGSPILLADDVRLQIRYLGVHELFQHVKVNATRYCGFPVAKNLSNQAFMVFVSGASPPYTRRQCRCTVLKNDFLAAHHNNLCSLLRSWIFLLVTVTPHNGRSGNFKVTE